MVKTLTPSDMAKLKWNGLTPEEKAAHVAKMKRGTRKRWNGLTPAEKKKQMKKLVDAKKKRRKTR